LSEGCSAFCSSPVGSRPACSIVTGRVERIREAYPWDSEALYPATTIRNPQTSCSMRAAVLIDWETAIETIPWSMWRL